MRWWFMAGTLVVLSIWGRVFFESRQELDAARAAESAGELDTAIEHYQYAARWYTPFASEPVEALGALERIGSQARSEGKRGLALNAFRRLRGAILSTRGIVRPGIERLDAVNLQIAELMAEEQLARGDASLRGRSKDVLIQDHLTLLTLDPLPSRGWSLLVLFSFLAWIVGVTRTIWKGMSAELKVNRQSFTRWAIFSCLAFGVWLFSLANA